MSSPFPTRTLAGAGRERIRPRRQRSTTLLSHTLSTVILFSPGRLAQARRVERLRGGVKPGVCTRRTDQVCPSSILSQPDDTGEQVGMRIVDCSSQSFFTPTTAPPADELDELEGGSSAETSTSRPAWASCSASDVI